MACFVGALIDRTLPNSALEARSASCTSTRMRVCVEPPSARSTRVLVIERALRRLKRNRGIGFVWGLENAGLCV